MPCDKPSMDWDIGRWCHMAWHSASKWQAHKPSQADQWTADGSTSESLCHIAPHCTQSPVPGIMAAPLHFCHCVFAASAVIVVE